MTRPRKLTHDELEALMEATPGSRIEGDPDSENRYLMDAKGREIAWSAGGAIDVLVVNGRDVAYAPKRVGA